MHVSRLSPPIRLVLFSPDHFTIDRVMAMASQADKEFYSETVKCDPGTPDTRQNTWILHWSLLDNTCIVADTCRVCGRNYHCIDALATKWDHLKSGGDGPVYVCYYVHYPKPMHRMQWWGVHILSGHSRIRNQ